LNARCLWLSNQLLHRTGGVWRRDLEPDVLKELAQLRVEVETLRKRIVAVQRSERRIVNRRQGIRPSSTERRRNQG
jgi:hypothetical protein